MATAQITYFERAGVTNTDAVIELVRQRLGQGDIQHVVVASTSGDTALKLSRALAGTGVNLTAVGEHTGFWGEDSQKFDPEARQALEEQGASVLLCSHALSGVGRSISNKFGGATPVEIIAHTLRRFGGDGVKVAVEVAVMAADAGLVPTDCDIVSVGGTGRGCDTALVLRAPHMNNFFELEIREILAKPRQRGG